MDNAIMVKEDGTTLSYQLDNWQESHLAEVLETDAIERVWSHSLIAFGASCQVAVMGYVDKGAAGKGKSMNPLAGKLLGIPVYGGLLLTYWDSHQMACGPLEPQEVEKITNTLRKMSQ